MFVKHYITECNSETKPRHVIWYCTETAVDELMYIHEYSNIFNHLM